MDAGDIPDLDDMSELVENIKLNKMKTPKAAAEYNIQEEEYDNSSIHVNDPKLLTQAKSLSKNKASAEFGGMKKGFLFSGGNVSSKPRYTSSQSKSSKTDIISPKNPKEDQKNPLVLDDVQNAMKENMDKSWVTDDLLKQVESNKKLTQQLSDPHIAKAISWMQKDPKAAMEYYKNDSEIQTFFKEFYGILGNHFTSLGAENSNSNANSEDEKTMQSILDKPEIKAIIAKPDIQKLIELLRNNPDEAQKYLNASSPTFRADVNKLVSAGILGFQAQ